MHHPFAKEFPVLRDVEEERKEVDVDKSEVGVIREVEEVADPRCGVVACLTDQSNLVVPLRRMHRVTTELLPMLWRLQGSWLQLGR